MRHFADREASPTRSSPVRRPEVAGTLTAQVQALQRSAGNEAVSRGVVPVVQRMLSEQENAEAGPSSAPASVPEPIRDEAQELRAYRSTVEDTRVGDMMDEALDMLSRVTFAPSAERTAAGASTTRAADVAGERRYTVNYSETPEQASAPPGAVDRMAMLFHELTHVLLNEELDDSDMLNYRVPALTEEALNRNDNELRRTDREGARQEARLDRANEVEPDIRTRRYVYVQQRAESLRALVDGSRLTEAHKAGAHSRLNNMISQPSLEYDPILAHLMVFANADGLAAGDAFYDRLAELQDEAGTARLPDAGYPIASAAETDAAFRTTPVRKQGIMGALQRILAWIKQVFRIG